MVCRRLAVEALEVLIKLTRHRERDRLRLGDDLDHAKTVRKRVADFLRDLRARRHRQRDQHRRTAAFAHVLHEGRARCRVRHHDHAVGRGRNDLAGSGRHVCRTLLIASGRDEF